MECDEYTNRYTHKKTSFTTDSEFGFTESTGEVDNDENPFGESDESVIFGNEQPASSQEVISIGVREGEYLVKIFIMGEATLHRDDDLIDLDDARELRVKTVSPSRGRTKKVMAVYREAV